MIRPSLLLTLVALSGCADYTDGVSASEAGEHERAREIFAGHAADEGTGASPALLHRLAVAALRVGDLDAAAVAAERAAEGGERYVGLSNFVRGNVAYARSEIAAEQARAVEAEPFAFDVAIRHADAAREAWGRAAASRDDWPAARRNAERAWLRAEALRAEKVEAEKSRETKRAGGGPPKINPVQQPPQKTDDPGQTSDPPDATTKSDDQGDSPDLALTEGELAPGRVLGVLETLRAKEDEKIAARRARRRARSSDVERDW